MRKMTRALPLGLRRSLCALVAGWAGLATVGAPLASNLDPVLWAIEPSGLETQQKSLHLGGAKGFRQVVTRKPVANGDYGFRVAFRLYPRQHRAFNAWIRHMAADGAGQPLWSVGIVRNEVLVLHARQDDTRIGVANTGPNRPLPTDTLLALEVVHTHNRATIRLTAPDSGQVLLDETFTHDDVVGGLIEMGTGGPAAEDARATGLDLVALSLRGDAVTGATPMPLPSAHGTTPLQTINASGLSGRLFANGQIELSRAADEPPLARWVLTVAGEAPEAVRWQVSNEDPLQLSGHFAFADGIALRAYLTAGAQPGELRVRLEAQNTSNGARWALVSMGLENLDTLGKTDQAIAFTRRGIARVDPPLQTRGVFDADTTRARWGTYVFGWSAVGLIEDNLTGQLIPDPAVETQCYIPVVQAYNDQGGVFVAAHPRIACGFEWGRAGARIVRNFYLPANETVATYDDGDGETPFEFHAGLRHREDWAELYHAQFYKRYHDLWPDDYARLDTFAMFSIHHTPLTDDLARRMAAAGGRGGMILKPNLFFTKAYNDGLNHYDAALAHRNGLKLVLWGNTRMTTDSKTEAPGYDPALSEQVYEDSLTRDAQGRTRRNWSGYSANPSPATRFGQDALSRIFDWIDTYALDGYFLDIYDDSIDVDWGRSYGRYPFYPIQTATIQFVKALHAGIKERGKILILNAPHPSLIVHRFADAIATDTGHGTRAHTAFWYKLQSANRPLILLGNPIGQSNFLEEGQGRNDSISHFEGMLRGLLYGAASPQHYWSARTRRASMWHVPNPAQLADLFAINQALSDRLAEARLIGGDGRTFSRFDYRHADGAIFVALQNTHRDLLTHEVDWAALVAETATGPYRLVEWDLLNGPRLLDEGDINVWRKRTERRTLRPFDDTLLILAPADQAAWLSAD